MEVQGPLLFLCKNNSGPRSFAIHKRRNPVIKKRGRCCYLSPLVRHAGDGKRRYKDRDYFVKSPNSGRSNVNRGVIFIKKERETFKFPAFLICYRCV